MNTLLGPDYRKVTLDEVQDLIRQAHYERAQAMRQALAAVFARRREAEAPHEHGCLNPAV